MSLKGRDILSLTELSSEEITRILVQAAAGSQNPCPDIPEALHAHQSQL